MRLSFFISVVILFVFHVNGVAQTCTALGQNPSTAFPVCGTSTFSQNQVQICGNRSVPGPCSGDGLTDKNPYWYKFKCFTAGTLGFVITPNTISDDYDWQLFDVTGKNVENVYSDASMVVSCNWSGEGGATGAASAGTGQFVCAGYGKPLYSSMPALIKDHEYLLLVSHFTNTQSGYKLEFKGGSANITDPTAPLLQSATTSCSGTEVRVRLNKKMRCQTLALNGSDFSLSPASAKIIKAEAAGCSGGFDMDSVVLTFDAALPPGNYNIVAEKGSDGNGLLDNCNVELPIKSSIGFSVTPLPSTPMDSLTPVKCAPSSLNLVFRNPIRCSSIAGNGSDFRVTGPDGVLIKSAVGNCSAGGTSTTIALELSSPISKGGLYTIHLQSGSDGNTLINDCGQATPADQQIQFEVSDTVSADFSYTVNSTCTNDQIQFRHAGGNGISSWKWNFVNRGFSIDQNPRITYSTAGSHLVKLLVSNKLCQDSTTITLNLDQKLQAAVAGPDILCPNEMAIFSDSSAGPVKSWNWTFGNGNTSTSREPPSQLYPTNSRELRYDVMLIVSDGANCYDTARLNVTVVNSCMIAVPSAFTPNGDGINDFLFPSNAWKASNLIFRVYNRFGQVIFETKDWTRKWDGSFGSRPQETGTYVWVLQYSLGDSPRRVVMRGTTVLIR